MNFEISSVLDLGHEDIARWRKFQQSTPSLSSPFLSPEFAAAKARHLTNQRLLVMYDGTEIVGFLPFEPTSRGVATIRALIIESSVDWNLADAMRAMNVSVLEYFDMPEQQLGAFSARTYKRMPSPIIDMSNGWDAWYAEKMTSSQFKTYAKKRRRLDREFTVAFDRRSTSHEDLDLMLKWKSDHFDRTGHYNRFANPNYRQMIHELLDSEPGPVTFDFSTLRADDRLIATAISFTSQPVVGLWHTTYDPDPAFDRYSAGAQLLLNQMESLANDGFMKADQGIGSEAYKEWFKNHDEFYVEGYSDRLTPTALLRRTRTVPVRLATEFVNDHPQIKNTARSLLRRVKGH
jgi:CelD/BcsL family acetyltransferase involved in cellulose biosynthesis